MSEDKDNSMNKIFDQLTADSLKETGTFALTLIQDGNQIETKIKSHFTWTITWDCMSITQGITFKLWVFSTHNFCFQTISNRIIFHFIFPRYFVSAFLKSQQVSPKIFLPVLEYILDFFRPKFPINFSQYQYILYVVHAVLSLSLHLRHH